MPIKTEKLTREQFYSEAVKAARKQADDAVEQLKEIGAPPLTEQQRDVICTHLSLIYLQASWIMASASRDGHDISEVTKSSFKEFAAHVIRNGMGMIGRVPQKMGEN